MTRDDVLRQYTVDGGVITSPGKFEAEPVYAPYFYELEPDEVELHGDGESNSTYIVREVDVAEFPELKGVSLVNLYESSDGFVYCVI